MKHKSFENMNCSIAKTLEVIGDRWSLLILRDAFYGVKKFGKFQEQLGIARNILSTRLNKLIDDGIMEKVYKTDGGHPEYQLTEKGFALQPVLLALQQWGDEYKPNPNGTRFYLVDAKTQEPIRKLQPTSHDGRPLRHDEVIPIPGPGILNS